MLEDPAFVSGYSDRSDFPDLYDCNSPGFDCYTGYGPEIEDRDPKPPFVPELDEDYLEAQSRAEEYFKMMEESLTIFEELYWKMLFRDIWVGVTTWSSWLSGKLVILGEELVASCFLGSVMLAAFGLGLICFGPLRLRTLALLIIVFVAGTTFALDKSEVPAFSIMGAVLILAYMSLTKRSSCRVVKFSKDGIKKAVGLRFDFWYICNRVLWVNFTEGLVGFHNNTES